MINVKGQVYAALSSVCENTTDVYPQNWEQMPALQYTEESNRVYTLTSEGEAISYLRYRVDIWNNGSTSDIALAVDRALASLGLVRIECQDVSDPSYRRHKQMRYEGMIDEASEQVYWNGSR